MATISQTDRIKAEYARRERELPADLYSIAQPVNQFFRSQLNRTLIAALVKEGVFPLAGRRICDVGCGYGGWLLNFVSLGADPTDLAGVDLIETRAAAARRKMPGAQIVTGSAEKLPWPDESFDLVTQFVVFTSILDRDMKQTVAREMMRITKTGGLILWYDFRYNNPRNANVLGVGAREIRSLFPGCTLKLGKVTLAPPLARAIVPISWTGALLIEKIPWLRTHHFAVIRKPAPPTSVL